MRYENAWLWAFMYRLIFSCLTGTVQFIPGRISKNGFLNLIAEGLGNTITK